METINKILRFRIGQESLPIVLNDEEQKSSPFESTIGNAIDCLEHKIATYSTEDKETDAGSENAINQYPDNWEYHTPNNIITFFGDRGSGKTSCMRSVVESCRRKHDNWMFLAELDPSFFDESHNILEILIGELYGIFLKDIDPWNQLTREKQTELRQIQDKFRKVKSAFRYLNNRDSKDNENESETDSLRHLNDGGKLRVLLKNLISGILKYHDKKMMVISIDDLDLNIPHSYVMMENIRKYLIMPEVAIIIAARYSQLFDSICLVLKKHYKEICNRVADKDISDMAEKYLAKMFPLDHRFDMPLPDSIIDATLIIEDKDGNITDKDENLSVAEKIPALIFDRTRFLFYNSVGMPSLIIPRNLRDLRMLVGMLYNMKPYDDNEVGAYNQRQFLSYFYQEWLETLDPEYREFALALTKEEDPAKVNRFVIRNLNSFFIRDNIRNNTRVVVQNRNRFYRDTQIDTQSDAFSREEYLLDNICNPGNSYWNVSVGDVVVLLNYVKRLHDSDKTRRLLFFIETYYSITLYRLYNKLTDNTDETGLIPDIDQPSSSQLLKATVHAEIPEYFRFIGGSFFSSTGDSFIPAAANDKEDREIRNINGKLLYDEIKNVVAQYDNLDENTTEYPTSLTARLTLCEFFMLTTKGRENLRSSNDTWRLSNEPLYFKGFGNSIRNIRFDATVPFVNAVYPKFCYDRFNGRIFSIAQKDPNSLLNKMTRLCNRNKSNDTWELMSKAALRNMEIIMDLTSWLTNKRDTLRPKGSGSLGILQEFYGLFNTGNTEEADMPTSGYCVKTYHRIANDYQSPFFKIDYSIYHLLGDVLGNLESDEPQDNEYKLSGIELFNAIMQENIYFEYKPVYRTEEVVQILSRCCKGVDFNTIYRSVNGPNISNNDLIRILVSIRIENGYDFTNSIDEQLQEEYEEQISIELDAKRNYYHDNIKTISNEIEELTSQSNQNILNSSIIDSSISNYQKQRAKIEETQKKLQDNKSDEEKRLSELKDSLSREADKVEEHDMLNKMLMESEKKLEDITTQLFKTVQNLDAINSEIDNAQKELTSLKKQNRSLLSKIGSRKRKRQQFEDELKHLEYNFNNPIPVKR